VAKQTVQDLILERVNDLGKKMDKLTSETVPEMMTAIAVAEATAKAKAKTTARFYGAIYGGVTIIVSLTGLAIAYFR
jgi:hypothetical protein